MKTTKSIPSRLAIKRKLRLVFAVSVFLAFVLSMISASAQTRQSSLSIPKGGVYEMTEDTLLVDELFMSDSSTLIVHKTSPGSYIKAQRIIIGSACTISGTGSKGVNGEEGKPASAPKGVCQDGYTGGAGQDGTAGSDGKNLTIVSDQLELKAGLHIFLKGGNGGDGGKGSAGSAGSQSSIHCDSHGGAGGAGGNGGNGGKGGIFTLQYLHGISSNDFCLKTVLHNEGGYHGFGGVGGKGGAPGHGASQDKSKRGAIGKKGLDGNKGIEGSPLFYSVKMEGVN